MPIEFQCPQCGKRLRTGDETAGRQARCPECQTVMTVPAASAPRAPEPGSPPARQTPPAFDDANPYAAGPGATATTASAAAGEIAPTIIDFGDVFATTWEAFKRNMGMCIGIVMIATIIQGAINQTTGYVLEKAIENEAPVLLIVVAYTSSIAINMCLSAFFSGGVVNATLKIARGQPPEIGDVFSGGPWFVSILLATLLFSLLMTVGCVLFVIPGVIVMLIFSQYYALIVDRNMGVSEAFSKSIEITRGNRWTLLGLAIVAWLTVVVSACTCIGLFFTVPYFWLMYAIAYLRMTGQPTVLEAVDRTAAY